MRRARGVDVALAGAVLVALAGYPLPSEASPSEADPSAVGPTAASAPVVNPPEAEPLAIHEAEGLRLRIWLEPADGHGELARNGQATLRISVHSAADDSLLPAPLPAAWLDRLANNAASTATENAAESTTESANKSAADIAVDIAADDVATAGANGPGPARQPDAADCRARIGAWLGGSLTERPWRDLAGYQVLLLNGDASLSILDPSVNFAGKTSLKSVVQLPSAGFDWDLTPRHDRLFVTLPETRQLAVIDLAGAMPSAPTRLLAVPGSPGRVAVQPDARLAWVGVPKPAPRRTNTGVQPGEGGVWLVDVAEPDRQAWVSTGDGHHEFAFDPDGLALVTNRDSGTVSFVDGRRALEVRRIAIGGVPIATTFDARERRFIVAEASEGGLHRFDHDGRPRDVLAVEPGLGPIRIAPGGRWLFALNPSRHLVQVVDLSTWQLSHTIPVGGRPFQLAFSTGYAYVRALDREDVTMIRLASLTGQPLVQRFTAGEQRPGDAAALPIASQFAPLPDDSGVFVLSPADNVLYTYMQGMNAPMAGVSPRGHPLRAVRVARQGLLEIERGVYEARVTLPSSPRALVALATSQPATRHCLNVGLAEAGPAQPTRRPTRIDWQAAEAGGRRVALMLEGDAARQWPRSLALRAFAPGGGQRSLTAERGGVGEVGKGAAGLSAAGAGADAQADDTGTSEAGISTRVRYEISLSGLPAGSYYLHLVPTQDGLVSSSLARQYTSVTVDED